MFSRSNHRNFLSLPKIKCDEIETIVQELHETKNQAGLRLLLNQKVDCDNADNDDWTALERAAAQRDDSTMELLFAAGARCRKQLAEDIFTAAELF